MTESLILSEGSREFDTVAAFWEDVGVAVGCGVEADVAMPWAGILAELERWAEGGFVELLALFQLGCGDVGGYAALVLVDVTEVSDFDDADGGVVESLGDDGSTAVAYGQRHGCKFSPTSII